MADTGRLGASCHRLRQPIPMPREIQPPQSRSAARKEVDAVCTAPEIAAPLLK